MCGLAEALLDRSKNVVLHMLQRVAGRKPAMAELLLPHIFADLAKHDADTTLMLTITEQVCLVLLRPLTFLVPLWSLTLICFLNYTSLL